jgi:quercetin dioxygenase-like cupin family protein
MARPYRRQHQIIPQEDDMGLTPASFTRVRPADSHPTPAAIDWHLGSLMIWHLLSEESDQALSLGEVIVRAGSEPPIHIHAREDETWFVLEGEIVFQRGHERIVATAGTAVLLPRGIPHGFAVKSDVARILHMYTPGGIDRVFRDLSTPAPRRELPPAPEGPPDPRQLRAIEEAFTARGVTFIGPPLPVLLAGELPPLAQ